MKKQFLCLAALVAALSFSAYAGNDVDGNCGQGNGAGNASCLGQGGQGGNGGAGGNGGSGGQGGAANSNNSVTNTNTNSATGGSATGGSATGGSVGNVSATVGNVSGGAGGAGGSASVGNLSTGASTATVGNVSTGASTATTGAITNTNTTGASTATTGAVTNTTGASNSGGNTISVTGDTYKAAAAAAYAPDGKAPRASCRLFVGFGGTNTSGSLSGGIPVGNDQTCVSGAQMEFMDKVNKVQPGTFGGGDYLRAACKVEGMDEMDGCKSVKGGKSASVASPVVVGTMNATGQLVQ